MRFTMLARAVLVAGATLLPQLASAQITVHTTLASYLAAISAPGTDTYNDLPFGTTVPPLSRTAGAYTYRARTANGGSLIRVGSAPDYVLSTLFPVESIVFDTFASTVRGVGGYFFAANGVGTAVTGRSVIVTFVSGAFSESVTIGNTTAGSFLGFTSIGAVTRLTIADDPRTGGPNAYVAANDLTLGAAAPATVIPEPSTYALMGTGLVGLAGVARRRRRVA